MLRALMLVVCWMLAGTAHAQTLLQLDKSFEGGLTGWTATGLWHHATASAGWSASDALLGLTQ